jgi:hypothetical protein
LGYDANLPSEKSIFNQLESIDFIHKSSFQTELSNGSTQLGNYQMADNVTAKNLIRLDLLFERKEYFYLLF